MPNKTAFQSLEAKNNLQRRITKSLTKRQ